MGEPTSFVRDPVILYQVHVEMDTVSPHVNVQQVPPRSLRPVPYSSISRLLFNHVILCEDWPGPSRHRRNCKIPPKSQVLIPLNYNQVIHSSMQFVG